jgi:hypothetical protein
MQNSQNLDSTNSYGLDPDVVPGSSFDQIGSRQEGAQTSYQTEKVDIKFMTIIKGILFLALISFILIFIFRPRWIIDPFKTYINAGYTNEIPDYSHYVDEEGIRFEENKIEITQQGLYLLVNDTLQKEYIHRIDFEDQKIIFLSNIAKKDLPLWLAIEVGIEGEKNIIVQRVGFGRFEFPKFIKEKVLQKILDAGMNLGKSDLTADILARFVGPEYSHLVKLSKIEIDDYLLILHLEQKEQTQEMDLKKILEREIKKFGESIKK